MFCGAKEAGGVYRLRHPQQSPFYRLVERFFAEFEAVYKEAGKVIYKTEHNAVGRFPGPGDQELLAGPSRNFQIFDPLDFLAEVTQHTPDAGEAGEHTIDVVKPIPDNRPPTSFHRAGIHLNRIHALLLSV